MNPDRFRRIREVLERRQPDLTVLMEVVNKTHNFSAILRTCDAVGVLEAHAVLPKKGIDLHHHTSAGTTRWVAVREHPSVKEALGHLVQSGFSIVAAHPGPDSVDFRNLDFTRPTAVLVGAELEGLSRAGLALADVTAAIPMAGMVRSLNVSVATALLLFEAFRQRQKAGLYEHSRLPEGERERVLFEWAYPEIARVYRSRGEPYPRLSGSGDILPEPTG
jgi:tRNA (guanosine-2'-O-)-methyltransferase